MKLPIFSLLLWAALTFNLSAESLQDAKSLIQTKKYKDAAELLEKLLKENGDGLKDEHFYYSARAHYLDANYTAARSSAEKLIDQFPESKWLTKAKFLIADTHFQEDKHEQAASTYRDLLKDALKQERKIEIAQKLIGYADSFSEGEKQDGIVVEEPNYEAAYNIYKEVLEIECGNELREKVRLQVIKIRQKEGSFRSVEDECLAYLAEFDEAWQGKIGSVERMTSKKMSRFLAEGSSVDWVRFALAESLNKRYKRKLATIYLNELIKQAAEGKLEVSKGVLADAEWLRLQTLCGTNGLPLDFDYWVREVRAYLENYPTHIYAEKTAFELPNIYLKCGTKKRQKNSIANFSLTL